MKNSSKPAAGSPRRSFLKAAASVTAGAVLTGGTEWAQNNHAGSTFPKIDPQFMITPD